MDFQKGLLVSEVMKLNQGSQAHGIFYVEKKRKADTKFGKAYLSLTLKDKTGSIDAKIWDSAEARDKEFQEKDFVSIIAMAEPYNGNNQLRIREIAKVDAELIDPAFFVKTSRHDIETLWQELEYMINSMAEDMLKGLLQEILLSDANTIQLLKTTAGAKKMHHAYVGGLLEHTIGVARLAEQVARLYPNLHRDLLVAGALLHDIGKIIEYTQQGVAIERSDAGRLIGHLVIGVQMIDKAALQLGLDQHDDRLVQLKHMILSHHGRYEYHSPTLPMTAEAFALHFIDEIDAKLNLLGMLQQESKEKGTQWSDYQRLYERQFYVPSLTMLEPENEQENDAVNAYEA